MKISRKTKIIMAIAAAVSINGCAMKNINDTIDRVNSNSESAIELAENLRNNKNGSEQRKTVEFTNDSYISFTPIKAVRGLPLESDCDITFNKDMELRRFAQTINKLCGVKINITSDVFSSNSSAAQGGSASQSGMSGIFPAGMGESVGSSSNQHYISGVKWEGNLSGLLDQVTTQLGLSWRYNQADNSISIYYLDTRTFNIYVFASQTEMQSVVQSGTTSSSGTSGGSSSGSSGGSSGVSGYSGSSQSTSVTMKTSITDDIEKSLKAMISPLGKISMASSTGSVTITDRPDVLDRVGVYLEAENKKITQQILLNVKVFSVSLSDKDGVGIDWNLVYKAANGNGSSGLVNNFAGLDSSAASGAIGILDGSFAGTTAVVKALSEQGRVSVVTSPSVTTLNLQPVPVQVARQTGYVASISTTNTSDVGSTTSITPGTVTSGFNMDLLPFVMPNKELLLQYSINISSLIKIRTVSSGEDDSNRIEVPEIDNRIFSQKVRLKSGSTLILSGFDQTSDNGSKTGVGSAWNMLMGGGAKRESTRDVIVVLITPIIQD